jgi:hypothetical protein
VSVVAGAQRTSLRMGAGGVPLGAVFAAAAALLALLGSTFHLDGLGFPVCVFKATTGIPCLTCGGTRALLHLAHLDVLGALAMNPLVATALIALVPWGIVDAVLALRRRALVLEVGPALGRTLRWAAVPLLLGNWAYLIAVGR